MSMRKDGGAKFTRSVFNTARREEEMKMCEQCEHNRAGRFMAWGGKRESRNRAVIADNRAQVARAGVMQKFLKRPLVDAKRV
jgi:hypothetical protein